MSLLRFIPELPLLKRELIELSNRRRTYVVRFVGAIVILSYVFYKFFETMAFVGVNPPGGTSGATWSPNKFLGSGGIVFAAIVPMLFNFVRMLMPALICGSITLEKERNTLGTLFVTRLSPFTIVLEKLGSRLIPMFTFLLLTFPLLAFVYSLGGVDTTMLLGTLWLLTCECVLFACIGLMCSSWFSTTVTAFVWAYVLTGLLIVFSIFMHSATGLCVTPYEIFKSVFSQHIDFGYGVRDTWLSPGAIYSHLNGGSDDSFLLVIFRTLALVVFCGPPMFMAFVCLMLARFFLIRRAFVSSSSALLRAFKKIDGIFVSLNKITDPRYLMWMLNRGEKPTAGAPARGIVLIRDYESLPLFDPVAWRERAKKSMGKARYLFRILVAMEGPTLFICLGAASYSSSTNFSGLRGLLVLIWGISAVILSVKASTMISSERTRETLDALLSTPLSSREIIEQKIAGMKRLMIVLAIPILSVHFTLLLMHFDLMAIYRSPSFNVILGLVLYCTLSVLTTYTLMHVIAWISTLMGIRATTQSRSVMAAFTVLAGWMLISNWLLAPSSSIFQTAIFELDVATGVPPMSRENRSPEWPRIRNDALVTSLACLIRPDGSIQANEGILVATSNARVDQTALFYYLGEQANVAFTASLIICFWHFGLMLMLREVTLKLAPRLLGRLDQQPATRHAMESSAIPHLTATESLA